MVKTLEQFTAEAEGAYKPAVDAVQNQINALPGQLAETNAQINRDYAQQRARLNNQRNDAAYNASMQAAGSGGSFGGAANIANRKYYSQSFVPAVTQMNTNHSNDLSQARVNNENQRLNLATQLANMQASSKQQALQAYYAAEEAEKNRALQRSQLAAQNAYNKYLMDAAKNANSGYTLSKSRNIYGGFDWTDAQGNKHRAATVAAAAPHGEFNENLGDILSMAADQGDYYSQQVLNELRNGARFTIGNGGTGNSMYDTLGIRRIN